MVKELLNKSKRLLSKPQSSIFSAASVIMVMIIASKVLGFIRQRVLFTFFDPASTDLFLAAFEVPDLIFEVFIYGVLSAAFIPVFSRYISKSKQSEGWHIAAASLNILLVVFAGLSILVFLFAEPLYGFLVGGFSKGALGISGGFTVQEVAKVASLSRVLLVAQLFFVVSSFTSAVLESYKKISYTCHSPSFL